jgi:hypothetical protein
MKLSKHYAAIIALAAVSAAAGPAGAAGVGPSRASDIVTLVSSGASCGGANYFVDLRVNPDGTTSPFEIPPGRVLVVTSAEWQGSGLPNHFYSFVLYAGNTAIISGPGSQSNGQGQVAGTVVLPTGAVVGRDAELCTVLNSFEVADTSVFPRIHGFLTKDR